MYVKHCECIVLSCIILLCVLHWRRLPSSLTLTLSCIHSHSTCQVWTNTCCSHPLTGMEPSEIDQPADVAAGTVPGVKNAAVRKLEHELGLTFPLDSPPNFKFLTRLRYWACDTVTHGATTAPWGEHEIDYVLFLTVARKESIVLQPHPDEVDAVRWVNPAELTAMMNDDQLLLSPWFRLICHKWLLPVWWKDLEGCMTTKKYCDYDIIHEFDPPTEHYGGAGNAGPLFGGSDTTTLTMGDSRYIKSIRRDCVVFISLLYVTLLLWVNAL
jgi:isopentenyl-diphosphate delta-isomerase type 1